MSYTVTVCRVDTAEVLNTVPCPDLSSALHVKSDAFRSHHHSDLGGQVVVPPTIDFDDWDDVDRLRSGNAGPYVLVHVSIHRAAGERGTQGSTGAGSTTTPALLPR